MAGNVIYNFAVVDAVATKQIHERITTEMLQLPNKQTQSFVIRYILAFGIL
ncbi:Uncharacterised protein [Klebsiella pneumoniae]|nr:Uncharacterised protein [Klebsiella pneumoniae]